MIINHRYKFIFVKTQKTAGSSIELALRSLCGPEDVFTPIKEYPNGQNYILGRNHSYHEHIGIQTIKKYQDTRGYFVFCFERNPWDKVVSYFHYHYAGQSWDMYLIRGFNFCKDWKRYTIKNQIAVDAVYKYENLTESLQEISEMIKRDIKVTERLKSDFRKDKRHYRDYYTPEQIELVAKEFNREIDYLRYSF